MRRWLGLLLLACVLACSAFGCSGGEPVGESEWALNTNDKPAFAFFVGKGLTTFQAAGIVGNLDQESNVIPTAVQQGGPGRGIAQWSAGGRWDTDGGDNAVWYANKQGQSVWSLQLQLEFIWYELTSFPSYGLSALKKTTNVSDATVVFETDFEGCGNCQQSTRIAYAKAVLNAYGAIPYGAKFVSQSFPLATSTLKMTAGQVLPATIELKNTGTKAWDSKTRIGTTQPRDRASAFADSTWLSPDRPAGVTGTVAPGATYKFQFDLAAPDKPGTYDEFFGVVEEGVTWFSAAGQGGPADDQLEVKILVVPGDGGAPVDDAGPAGPASGGDAGAGPVTADAGEDGGAIDWGVQAGAGCSIGGAPDAGASRTGGLSLLVLGALAAGLRRRRVSP